MAQRLEITCDGCGKRKQEANHWWTAGLVQHPFAVFITPAQEGVAPCPPCRMAFDESHESFDFCGRECALKFISEKMGESQ